MDTEDVDMDMDMDTFGAGFVDHGCDRLIKSIQSSSRIVFDYQTYRWHLISII